MIYMGGWKEPDAISDDKGNHVLIYYVEIDFNDMFVYTNYPYLCLGHSVCHSVPMLALIGQPNCQKVKVPSDWLMSLSVECKEAGIK